MHNRQLWLHESAATTGAERDRPAITAADRLSLAAAPTFAVMALLTGVLEAEPAALCLGADASPLGGMLWMYLLMSVFHLAPWLRLIAVRRHARGRHSPLDVGPSPAQPS